MSEQYNTNLHIVSMCDILAKSTERAVSSRYVVLVRLHRWLQVFRQAAGRLYIWARYGHVFRLRSNRKWQDTREQKPILLLHKDRFIAFSFDLVIVFVFKLICGYSRL